MTLNICNSTALIVPEIFAVPGLFASPLEILRAGRIMEKFELERPKDGIKEWLAQPLQIGLSEVEFTLLKSAVEKVASRLAVNKDTLSLLQQLGFSDS